ncbi:MAG: hypothetical protein II153_04120 [Erysipelotrichaceae bacterium]|nr:hypothetical protein [Erysipelotrichaceae bacterium]MBQ5444849.1 hypothetical protein [Erysipelotrichaceae bacterium]
MKKIYSQCDLYKARSYIFDNREEIQRSELCGCYFCEKMFFPYEVKDFVEDEDGKTSALCPYCRSLAVISDASGYRIDRKLLHAMNTRWY